MKILSALAATILILAGCGGNSAGSGNLASEMGDVKRSQEPGDRILEGLCMPEADASSLDDDRLPFRRILVDSPAIAYYMSLFDVPLIGIPTTNKALPEEYEGLPEIGIPVDPNIEAIVSLNPDLFVGDRLLEQFTKKKLEENGIPSVYLDNSTYDSVYESIIQLGRLLGREEIGNQYVDCQKEKEQEILARTGPLKGKKVALVMGTAEFYKLGTKNSYVGSLLEKIGVDNVANRAGNTDQEYISFSKERLIAEDPDYLLALSHGGNPAEVKKAFEEEFSSALWEGTAAKSNNRIFYLDNTHYPVTGTIFNVETLERMVNLMLEDPRHEENEKK